MPPVSALVNWVISVVRRGQVAQKLCEEYSLGCEALRKAKTVTYDMKPHRDDPTAVGTFQVADAVIEKLHEQVVKLQAV